MLCAPSGRAELQHKFFAEVAQAACIQISHLPTTRPLLPSPSMPSSPKHAFRLELLYWFDCTRYCGLRRAEFTCRCLPADRAQCLRSSNSTSKSLVCHTVQTTYLHRPEIICDRLGALGMAILWSQDVPKRAKVRPIRGQQRSVGCTGSRNHPSAIIYAVSYFVLRISVVVAVRGGQGGPHGAEIVA
jgi:hypothetical protein